MEADDSLGGAAVRVQLDPDPYSAQETMARLDDLRDMLNAAADAIVSALADGARGGKHPAGSWRKETIAEQLWHIEGHIVRHRRGDLDEHHLAHLLCRAAIAYALAQMQVAANSGTDAPAIVPESVK
jgi:hypothetical protein